MELGLGFSSGFQMDETEVEEGEACYYRDNPSFDPDTALSYIDEKLQNVLGHFQKDFEGGISADNLGAKFGGYGSFLPTYQRYPSKWSHPKNSEEVQNFSSPKSPNMLHAEGAPANAARSTRPGTALCFLPSSNTAMAPSEGIPEKKSSRLSSVQGNSCQDNSGVPPQCAGAQESPRNILQIMTCFPIPGGSPLSPLIDSLLWLEKKEKQLQNSGTIKSIKKFSKEKKRMVEKKENMIISNGETGLNLGDRKAILTELEVDVNVGNMESGTLGQESSLFSDNNLNLPSRKQRDIGDNKTDAVMAPPVCKEAEGNMSWKKTEVTTTRTEKTLSRGFFREASLESISDKKDGNSEKKDFGSSSMAKITERRSRNIHGCNSVDGRGNLLIKTSENYTVANADSDVPNCSIDTSGRKAVGHGVEKPFSKGKKKSKRSQNSVDLASATEGNLISGSYEVSKGKELSSKMCNLKVQDYVKMVHEPEATGEQVSNQMYYPTKSSFGNRASKYNRNVVKKKQGSSLNKSREISTHKDVRSQLISGSSFKVSANDDDLSLQVGLVSMMEPTPVEPTVIEEHWVQCDHCETWRLLPYGTKPEQLPEKWVCKMLNWLPGMNRCDFSEDDTTQALRRLYLADSQSNFTNNVDSIVPDASSAEGLHLGVNHRNPSSNGMPIPRRVNPRAKETHCSKSNVSAVQIPGSVNNFEQDVVKSRRLNTMNLPRSNLTSNSQIKNLSKSHKFSVETSTHKHEEKHEDFGESKEKKMKRKRVADQHEHGTPKRTRMDVAFSARRTTKKVMASAMIGGELPHGSSEIEIHGEREISLKKRKLKDWQESQNCTGVPKVDRNHLDVGKDLIKKTRDNELTKVKKSAISNVEEKESIPYRADEKLKSVSKVTKLKNSVHGREKTFGLEKEQQARKHKTKGSASDDMDILNRELVSGQFSRVSSSSKVLVSLRNRSHFLKVKGSPVESVSSSPVHSLDFGQLSPARRDNLRENASKNAHIPMVESGKRSLIGEGNTEKSQSALARRVKVSGVSHSESLGLSKVKGGSSGSNPETIKRLSNEMLANPKDSLRNGAKTGPHHVTLLHGDPKDMKCRIKLVKDDTPQTNHIQGFNDGVSMRSDITYIETMEGRSLQAVSNHNIQKSPSVHIHHSVHRLHKGNSFDVVPVETSCSGDSSKVIKQCKNTSSPLRNDALSQSNATFKKAEELKDYGDRLKDSGFAIESNETYFGAVLHFLHSASLRESCSYDSNKHGEMSPIQIYSSTAKLCELCGNEFEKHNELAAAALAYKCVEIAYLRVVYIKNSIISRDRQDLQASLQIVPQGESPSSSVSDVDSLNYQVIVDNAALSKSVGTRAGNHIIDSRNLPNFVRLLDFTKDVNSAMEASYKTQNTFAAAIDKGVHNNDGVVSVKRVIEFSFQDVDELVRLVRVAINSIRRRRFTGCKD